jgi:hypothetical protein
MMPGRWLPGIVYFEAPVGRTQPDSRSAVVASLPLRGSFYIRVLSFSDAGDSAPSGRRLRASVHRV